MGEDKQISHAEVFYTIYEDTPPSRIRENWVGGVWEVRTIFTSFLSICF